MSYQHIQVPEKGEKITFDNGTIQVPNNPIITYIEGDGIGSDVSPVMKKVIDHIVAKTYNGEKSIQWMDVYAGEKANDIYGEYLPQETLDSIKEFSVSIKGPLTTPVGGGMPAAPNMTFGNIPVGGGMPAAPAQNMVRPEMFASGMPVAAADPEFAQFMERAKQDPMMAQFIDNADVMRNIFKMHKQQLSTGRMY